MMTMVQRGMMITWHSTINIQMTNTHSMLELQSRRKRGKQAKPKGRNQLANSSLINAAEWGQGEMFYPSYAPEHILPHLTIFLLLILIDEFQCPSIEILATDFLIRIDLYILLDELIDLARD